MTLYIDISIRFRYALLSYRISLTRWLWAVWGAIAQKKNIKTSVSLVVFSRPWPGNFWGFLKLRQLRYLRQLGEGKTWLEGLCRVEVAALTTVSSARKAQMIVFFYRTSKSMLLRTKRRKQKLPRRRSQKLPNPIGCLGKDGDAWTERGGCCRSKHNRVTHQDTNSFSQWVS